MPKRTSWAEMMSSGEKIELIVFAIIELHWSEGISQSGSHSQSGSQSVENSLKIFFLKLLSNFLKEY